MDSSNDEVAGEPFATEAVMIAFLVGGALLAGALAIGLLTMIAVVIRAVFWLVLLPFKILVGALSLALVIPMVLIAVGLLVFFAVLTPLLPLVLLALIVWGLVRIFERPARVRT
jgi:hypothetical protein